MAMHLSRELDRLKQMLLDLSNLVEESQHNAVRALVDRNPNLAAEVIDGDRIIDAQEVLVEEECLKILALHQPVATDLRFIISAMKLNHDLERVGDLAVNLAKRTLQLARLADPEIVLDFPGMAARAEKMLRDSLDALVNLDAALAHRVCAADDEVDAMNRAMYAQIRKALGQKPEHIDALLHLLSASRHLERVADHATNIAEDIIYLIEGEIVRHGGA